MRYCVHCGHRLVAESLRDFAECELRRAGLFDEDSDYAGALGHAVLKMVEGFSQEGHSGASAALALQLFDRLARRRTLTPCPHDATDDPAGEGYRVCRHCCSVWNPEGVMVVDTQKVQQVAAQIVASYCPLV